MTRRAALALALLLWPPLAGQVGAAPARPAEAVIRKTVDDGFAVLRERSLAGHEQRSHRIAALRRIADQTFDWAEMARGSLGVQWRSLDAAHRTRFVDVFKDVLAAQYMDDMDRFQGNEVISIDGSDVQGDDVSVRTTLVTASRDRVPIDYRLRLAQGQWRVIDVNVEGVSLVNHFRGTFAAALVNMSIDQLIERLRHQLPSP